MYCTNETKQVVQITKNTKKKQCKKKSFHKNTKGKNLKNCTCATLWR